MHTEFLTKPKESAECHQTLSSRVGSGHETIVLTQVDVPCGHPCASLRGTASGWLRSVGGTPRSLLAQQTPAINEDNFKLVKACKSFVHIGETPFGFKFNVNCTFETETDQSQSTETDQSQSIETDQSQSTKMQQMPSCVRIPNQFEFFSSFISFCSH